MAGTHNDETGPRDDHRAREHERRDDVPAQLLHKPGFRRAFPSNHEFLSSVVSDKEFHRAYTTLAPH